MKSSNAKKIIIPSIYVFSVTLVIASILIVVISINKFLTIPDDYNYSVNESFETTVPVVDVEDTNDIIRPYLSENVEIGKYFYDFEGDEERQSNSIIFYENTYMQNTGVDYISEKEFDVISVLDGEIISVETDPTLGNIVKIKHDKNLVTVYQGINNLQVKEEDVINKGTIIGTSGTSKINTNYTTSLHFEVYYNGELIDPENFYNLNIEDL